MDSKETVKIEAPPSSTVDDLKTLIAQELSPPPPPSSLRLSLNRKDEIGSSPDESLSSVGLTSGDLVFYSVNPDAFEHVVVKFMVLGKSVVVYGCLSGKSADTFRLSLDSTKFIPSIEFVKRSCRDSHEKEIFELWKIVKDTLCLPLMIDLCEKKKLSIPACFPFLPTDLKIKILEFLQGADLARAACVSSELKYLSATDDLWKRRLEEEFGLSDNAGLTGICWKDRFASHWMSKKRSERARRSLRFRPARLAPHFPTPFRRPRLFHPFNLNVVGGDYDRFPVPGDRFPAITDIIRGPGRVNFVPRCNLGGFNA
ncbi:putative F-box protein [Acorus gramineus]|uniref:F-box protein n=1 Tax=Acorus gramineus TaxID=55184 RepID=A0AAV9BEN2_ACOGR|nr:putative F-box protein [Acorus gramineus]